MWCIFLLRKWLKSLEKAIVNTPGAAESSWKSPFVRFLANRVHWSPGGKWEGSRNYMAEKGDPITWVLQVVGKRVDELELLLE
jgi:hypothetical protein